MANDSGLGFAGGAELTGVRLVLVVLACHATRLNRVLLFWIAFMLTRPFGACSRRLRSLASRDNLSTV